MAEFGNPLVQTEPSRIAIEHQSLAGNERDVEERPGAVDPRLRGADDEMMSLEPGGPDGRKIVSLAHQFGAFARQIAGPFACSFVGHRQNQARCNATGIDLDQCRAAGLLFGMADSGFAGLRFA